MELSVAIQLNIHKSLIFLIVNPYYLQTNRSPLHFSVGSADSITSVFHKDEELYTQQKGGTIKSWKLTNSGYKLNTSLCTTHTGFCRFEYVSKENILISPQDENTIIGLDENDLNCSRITLSPAAVGIDTNLGQIMCFKFIDLLGQGYLLACYESGDFLTWDLRTGKVIDQKQFEECPMAVDYDPITNRGIYGGPSDQLGVFGYSRNTAEIMKRGVIALKNPGINCISIRRDQKVFSAGGWDGRIRIFSWKSLRPLAVLTDHKAAVTDISYSNDKVTLWKAPIMAASGLDGQISLWDLYN